MPELLLPSPEKNFLKKNNQVSQYNESDDGQYGISGAVEIVSADDSVSNE